MVEITQPGRSHLAELCECHPGGILCISASSPSQKGKLSKKGTFLWNGARSSNCGIHTKALMKIWKKKKTQREGTASMQIVVGSMQIW